MLVNRSLFPIQSGAAAISKMQQRLGELQTQLGSGDKTATLAGMGSDRSISLAVRGRLSAMDGFAETATTVKLRLGVLDKVMGRLDKIESTARTSATPGDYGSDGLKLAAAPSQADSALDEVISLLNSQVSGRYLLAGSNTDKAPVASKSAILDGANGMAGFRQVANERLQADQGADGMGRLTLGGSGGTVTLAEDGTHPFGFKLSTLSTNSSAVGVTQPSGTPPSLGVSFNAQPVAGESVTVNLTLPDGTSSSVTLKAASGNPATGEFAIGANPAETAANFRAALGSGLQAQGRTTLAAASNYAAAENFFNASGAAVMRVDGPPFSSATALRPATSTDTVQWYNGEDSATARQTVTAKVDDGTRVDYGVQANEKGLVDLVRTLAVGAIGNYPADDAGAKGRFDAIALRQIDRLAESNNQSPGSIEGITMQLQLAASTVDNVAERHTAYKAQLAEMRDSAEKVSVEDVAVELLALKTRLEASYSTTSMVSQLSLVNYMR